MKFLITGLGSIGRRHLRNLVSLGEKDILLYRTRKSTMPEEDLAGYATVYDYEEALAAKPDAVIVSNPTSLHLDIAIPAAERGMHLLLEKPISHNYDRVDRLVKAVGTTGAKVLVGFQYRFHPTLGLLRQAIHEGAIGRPVTFRVHWGEYMPGWHPWEDYRKSYAARPDLGGGVVLTLCHPFDYLRWIFGEVDGLWAFTAEAPEIMPGIESSAEVGMQFMSGVAGTVHLNYVQQSGIHKMEVVGTDGLLSWDNTSGDLRIFNNHTREWTTRHTPEGFERNHLFISEMHAFLNLINGESLSTCTLDDGIKALDITLAVHRSAGEHNMIYFNR